MSHDLTVQPSPTTPAAPASQRPSLAAVKGRLKVSRTGNVAVRLSCAPVGTGAAPAACLTVAHLQASLGGKKRTIAEKVATLRGTSARTIHLRLNQRALKTLERKRLRATLRVQVHNPGAATETAARRLTIRRR
jgi:hypothetical protein